MSAGVHSINILHYPRDGPDAIVGGCELQLTMPGAQETSISLFSEADPTGG